MGRVALPSALRPQGLLRVPAPPCTAVTGTWSCLCPAGCLPLSALLNPDWTVVFSVHAGLLLCSTPASSPGPRGSVPAAKRPLCAASSKRIALPACEATAASFGGIGRHSAPRRPGGRTAARTTLSFPCRSSGFLQVCGHRNFKYGRWLVLANEGSVGLGNSSKALARACALRTRLDAGGTTSEQGFDLPPVLPPFSTRAFRAGFYPQRCCQGSGFYQNISVIGGYPRTLLSD